MHNDPLTVGILCGRYFNELQAEVKCKAHETCRAMVSCQQEVVTNSKQHISLSTLFTHKTVCWTGRDTNDSYCHLLWLTTATEMRPFQDSGHVAVSKINVASMYTIYGSIERRYCILLPVCKDAVAAALPVRRRSGPQQFVLTGVQRHQQIDHQAGVMDGLAEHRALLALHQLLLFLFTQTGPST